MRGKQEGRERGREKGEEKRKGGKRGGRRGGRRGGKMEEQKWKLDDEAMKALEMFRSGEMKAALKARRDEVQAMKEENRVLKIQRNISMEIATMIDRGMREVRGERMCLIWKMSTFREAFS